MVQVLTDPALSPLPSPAHEHASGWPSSHSSAVSDRTMSREEHAQRMRDLNLKRALTKTPKRGWSITEGDPTAPLHAQFSHPVPIPENAPLPQDVLPAAPKVGQTNGVAGPQQDQHQLGRRPKLPTPRRSYTVMDYDPVMPPGLPRPSPRMSILNLPSELHYTMFDWLDPIDSACLGLAHSRLYEIHRRKHGKVALSSRYDGPNDLEWAWRGAGPLRGEPSMTNGTERSPSPKGDQSQTPPGAATEQPQDQQLFSNIQNLEKLRVKGQVYCRKCGINRCELQRHLQDWMGPGWEYCGVKELFCAPAAPEAKGHCSMPSPKNRHKCGRHGARKEAKTAGSS